MYIEIHLFTATMRRLSPENVQELIKILGIHPDQFKRKIGYQNGSLSLSHAFAPAKESVYLQLGVLKQLEGDIQAYYHCPRLTLHGSYFDNSPEFDLERLLRFLERFQGNIHALDIAYCDDQAVTNLEDWLRVFGADYQVYCLGNLFKRSGAPGVRTAGGRFERVEIGKASSSSSYATMYRRPNGTIRLELKYRDPEQIAYLLELYSQNDRSLFNERALQALVSAIDIVTPDTKRTRNPDRYEREPFYAAFLASEPARLNWSTIKAEMQMRREQSELDQYTADLKRLTGYLNNVIARTLPLKPLDEIIADLAARTQYPVWATPALS